jgi:hypothetical protein
MPTDQLVTTDHVLKAVMELDRRGSTKVLSELEKLEPDMVEYLLETLTRLYHQLTDLGLSGKEARKVYHRAEKTALVCVMSLRKAHYELWQRDHGDDEPPSAEDSPPPTEP